MLRLDPLLHAIVAAHHDPDPTHPGRYRAFVPAAAAHSDLVWLDPPLAERRRTPSTTVMARRPAGRLHFLLPAGLRSSPMIDPGLGATACC